jgi:hypothetical protein
MCLHGVDRDNFAFLAVHVNCLLFLYDGENQKVSTSFSQNPKYEISL